MHGHALFVQKKRSHVTNDTVHERWRRTEHHRICLYNKPTQPNYFVHLSVVNIVFFAVCKKTRERLPPTNAWTSTPTPAIAYIYIDSQAQPHNFFPSPCMGHAPRTSQRIREISLRCISPLGTTTEYHDRHG